MVKCISIHHHHPTPRREVAHHNHHAHDDVQARVLDLDAEVLAEHIAAVTAWLTGAGRPHQILDLGAGTGAGSFALLTRFPDAHLDAVDASAPTSSSFAAKLTRLS